ncbi:MAG: HAMP domain-containing sensor histidine kinase [Blautia sp.]|nr:HAMP domain-containing histidine kinase [Blautia sp.]MDY4000725.1 HAMP domain-containing sensor histidine kinase [Blautia sp.]
MKKKWYRGNFVKILLILIFTVSLALAAVGGAFLISMESQGIRIWGDEGKTYLESQSLAENVFQSSYEILKGIQAESMYSEILGTESEEKLMDSEDTERSESTSETGTGEKIIDLETSEILETSSVAQTSGLVYSVEDIGKWAQTNWENYDQQIIACVTAAGQEYYYYKKDFLKMVSDGKIVFHWEKGCADYYGDNEQEARNYVLELLQNEQVWKSDIEGLSVKDGTRNVDYVDIYNWSETLMEEKYPPIGADNLLDAVNHSEKWQGRLSEAVSALENTLRVAEDVNIQIEALEKYQEGNTNLTYLYVDLVDKKVYTNRSEYRTYRDYETAFAKNSAVPKNLTQDCAYVLVKQKLADCQSNLNFSDDSALETWQHTVTQMGISDDFVFVASVDGQFPIMDELARASENYDEYMSARSVAGKMLGLAVVLFVVSIVWLTIISGKRTKDEEVHLNILDRIFTEAAAVCVVCIWISGLAFILDFVGVFANVSVNSEEFYMVAVIIGIFTAWMFLMGYLSLVRRIKAGTIWKNSLLRWLLQKTGKMWRFFWSKTKKAAGILVSGAKEIVEFFSKNTGSRIKMFLLLGSFLILQFILTVMVCDGGAFFLLVLTVADCAVMLYFIRKADGMERILEGLKRITNGELRYKIPAEQLAGEQKEMAEYINHIGEGLDAAVENSLKNERMKTELITNVSHDIKTPLTSIINYVDLLQRENFTDPKICGYLDVLDEKAHRLKVLTEDVVEASKASSGAISLELANINFIEMLHQVMGEFDEKFQEKNLSLMVHLTDEAMMIRADGRRLWRVLDNVFGNVVKYAMEGTRVYAEATPVCGKVTFSLKNISAQPLNISAEELTERFIRGDSSRNTEGSGLGLSIAQSLTELQGGEFKLYLDGDLFKVMITFPLIRE